MAASSWLKRIRNTFTSQTDVSSREAANDLSISPNPIAPPAVVKLLHTLESQADLVGYVSWSPDGRFLAFGSSNKTIQIWDTLTGQALDMLTQFTGAVRSVAWSPDGNILASGHEDYGILWDTQTWQLLHTFTDLHHVVWSPDGKLLASGSRLWDTHTMQPLHIFTQIPWEVNIVSWSPDGKLLADVSGDFINILDMQDGDVLHRCTGWRNIVEEYSEIIDNPVWSPDGRTLACSCEDKTIQLWDTRTGKHTRTLEGHTDEITNLSFSSDGRLLASKSVDQTVRLWRTDIWKEVEILKAPVRRDNAFYKRPSLAFHPKLPVLAISGEEGKSIYIWEIDVDILLQQPTLPSSVSYINAKVVLLGDSGVGKSGLGLVLSGQPFEATESTHGRRVWAVERLAEVEPANRRKETRETLLWDLAGQPGYRLVHQLYLNEVTVALVVLDAHSETDPFAGVEHWCRALAQAQHIQGSSALTLKKILVQARCDRGGISVSQERIQVITDKFGLDGYFTTSAKEGWGIVELQAAIRKAIEWDALPKVTSTVLFQQIKQFLITEKESGRLISTENDLYYTFLKLKDAPKEATELRAQFETCIGRVESAGLIKRLSFGKLVFLQPEMLDTYASALVDSVKDEPDGLGSITEECVRRCDFRMPQSERFKDQEQESLLLIAMVEDLLRSELALREEQFLIFPSQSTRENPDLPAPEGKSVVFAFEGPIYNIYATLAVRLSHSGLFKKKGLWKNAISYTANVGGTCGLFLRNIGEGCGELTLFFEQKASEETRFNFEQFVLTHLQSHVVRESLKRRRLFTCDICHEPIRDETVQRRRARGFSWLNCPVCENRIDLLDSEERLSAAPAGRIMEMHRTADSQRDREVLKSTVEGKQAIKDFDVFLCHNWQDKPAVRKISKELKERGLLPWLDEEQLQPGLPWQRRLEEQIAQIKAAAVFVGRSGLGPWQHQELDAFLREFVRRGCPVIPVLLADAAREPALPVFLKAMTWVDFRSQDPDPMLRLLWGITGRRDVDEGMRAGER